MKKLTIGLALVIIGVVVTAYTGSNLIAKGKVIDVDAIRITKEISHPVQWSPIVGLALFAGGILILVRNRRVLY